MSTKSNQYVSYWKDVENFITRRIPALYSDTSALDDDARLIVRDAYMLWYLCTWDTLSLSGHPLTASDTNRWLIAVCEMPVLSLVSLLKEASHQIVSGDFHSYDAFKQHLRKEYPTVGAIIAPIRRELHDWFQETDTDSLNLCYSWLLFISRLNLPGLDELEKKALRDYLSIESSIQEDGFTSEEQKVLERWFPRTLPDRVFFEEHHSPEHGPGATSDAGSVQQDKYLALCSDQRLDMLHNRVGFPDLAYPRISLKRLTRTSRTIFVPKSLGAYRTISMEPASLMWHQKGVRNALVSFLKRRKHYLLRRFDAQLQQPNRDLAWEGSIDGSFSTIDLSSASDTVSWDLVKKWFGNTSLYPWLLWTRSTHTLLPDGTTIKLRKYAPMGSDLCFPIESLIFSAITECAIVESCGNPMSSRYRVYGDDIVVEEAFSDAVLRRLSQNGFIPNLGKTFSGKQPRGFFRESCGSFFFNGVDISPVRLSRWFSGYSRIGEDTPGRIESVIEFANDCYSRYPSVRRWLVNALLRLPVHLRPPFSSDGSVGLFSTQPTNYHLLSKESLPLQCKLHTFGRSSSPKRDRKDPWEDIRLFEYLRQTKDRQRLTWPEDRVDVYVSQVKPASWVSRSSILY